MERPSERGNGHRTTPELVRSVVGDTGALMRAEAELARQEIVEGVTARIKGAVGFVAAGVIGFAALIFGAAAGASALAQDMAPWLALLLVSGGMAMLALLVAVGATLSMHRGSITPQHTMRTVKEEVAWAKDQLKH